MNPGPDAQRTTVIDVTCLCNARCRYCQWGDPDTPGRSHRPLDELLLPPESLRALGTERVVLSGGEPRLHPRLSEILSYYRPLVRSVVVITNGYGLNEAEARRLADAGATGMTVSLDSTDPREAAQTRGVPAALFKRLMGDLERISRSDIGLELGINSVVSRVTARWATVRDLLGFGRIIGASFVKFQPAFDDGYLGRNAPDLMLSHADAPNLVAIAAQVDDVEDPPTNPPGFWHDIASLLAGNGLPAAVCGLGPRQSIAIRGRLGICFWLESVAYGSPGDVLTQEEVVEARVRFETAKRACTVGFQCFCTQSLSHVWRGNTD